MAKETMHPAQPAPQRSDPVRNAAAITPDDSNDIANVSRMLYVGAGGDLKVTMAGGQSVTLVGVPAGWSDALAVSRIWSTGTTAASIVAFW